MKKEAEITGSQDSRGNLGKQSFLLHLLENRKGRPTGTYSKWDRRREPAESARVLSKGGSQPCIK